MRLAERVRLAPLVAWIGLLFVTVAVFPSPSLGQRHPISAGGVVAGERVPLTRQGHPGDSVSYAIERENLTLGRDGAVLSTIKVSGLLVRSLVEEVEDGVWTESVAWRDYKYGQGGSGDGVTDQRSHGEVESVRYVIDPRDRNPEWFGAIPTAAIQGSAATLFPVLVLDVWSWDAMIHELRRVAGRPVQAGETHDLAAWSEARPFGSESEGLSGGYQLGPSEVTVVGVSVCGDNDHCLRLMFRSSGNEVSQAVGEMRISGSEYFVGTADVSLTDGALVSGELWGPLVATFALDGTVAPINAVLQRVSIRRLAR